MLLCYFFKFVKKNRITNYTYIDSFLIIEQDTFKVFEITESKLKFGQTIEAPITIEGEEFGSIPHEYYFVLEEKL